MRHKTSIIILSYNTLEMLQLCIESVREHTEEGTYEIIVVENASKDGSAGWLKEQEDLRCIYNEENQGFPKGCNQGLAIAEGTELLLLNSDTIVTKNWLSNLRRALYSSSVIGVVSCVTNACSNGQQIEVSYQTLKNMQEFAAAHNVSNSALWEKRTTLVGFCYLFKREVFEEVGFFDERFGLGNFEDDDYSLRILQAGYDLLVCRDTFIHHFGHGSFLRGDTEQERESRKKSVEALVVRNERLFKEKWHVPEMYKVMSPEELRCQLQEELRVQECRASLDGRKIAVLVRKADQARYDFCMVSLQNAEWPKGYAVEYFMIDAARPYAAQVNKVLAETDAKYKIYINDDVCLVRKQAIKEMLAIFEDEGIAMLGIFGSQSLPVSGNLFDSSYKCGAVYLPTEGDISEMRFGDVTGDVMDVCCLLPAFFATQRDIPWDEYSYKRQYYAVLEHSYAMRRFVGRVVISMPAEIWCAYQVPGVSLDVDEGERKRFFSAYHAYITGTEPEKMNTLYVCGKESKVPSWWKFSHPEAISVGEATHIHETARLRLAMPNFAGEPRIVVGDHVEIGAGSTITAAQCIEIENAVSIAENVNIKDYRFDESGLGLSLANREIIAGKNGIRIERGVCLEENVLVKGDVHIGRGSVVRAGSVVCMDLPAYCIAEGTPAHVIKAFSPREGKWLPTAGEKALERVLAERRKTRPLLTYAFITYNRSQYLKKSLRCVLQQIGNDELAEILVSDNASTDDTRTFVEEMQKTYMNLRYHCNEKNIAAEGNIHKAIEKSRGEYVIVAGDDASFIDGALHVVLSNIIRYRGVGLFYLGNENIPLRVYEGKGCLDWIRLVSYYMAWITSVVMRRELYAQIPEPHRYDDTCLPQVYLELEMLKQRPAFAVLHGFFFADGSGDHRPKGYNFAEVFIKNYFDILTATVEILPEQLSAEKKWVMEESILPWCRRIKENGLELSLEGIFDIVEKYYGKEPYYEQVVEALKSIMKE